MERRKGARIGLEVSFDQQLFAIKRRISANRVVDKIIKIQFCTPFFFFL